MKRVHVAELKNRLDAYPLRAADSLQLAAALVCAANVHREGYFSAAISV